MACPSRAKGPADAPMVHAGANGGLVQHIRVTPRQRAGATVKRRGHDFGPLDGDVPGQLALGRAPRRRCAFEWRVKVDHLHHSMHASIGAPAHSV
jgi:hypothetical protein